MKYAPLLSTEEELALANAWRDKGDRKALDKLVAANLRLVVSIAAKYQSPEQSVEDLIGAGNVGLTIAAFKYEPKKNLRFATYATYWVRAYIFEHIIRNRGPVRIGRSHPHRKIFFGLGRARRELEHLGLDRDSPSLARLLGVKVSDVDEMLLHMTYRPVELDAPTHSDAEDIRTWGDVLLDGETTSIEDTILDLEERKYEHDRLVDCLSYLSPRERIVIRERHMRKDKGMLVDIGKKLGVTRERVRQLEVSALKKIRACVGGAS